MSLCKMTQHWPLRTQITVSCVSVLFLWPIYPLTVLVLCRLLISNIECKQAFHSQPVQSFFWGLAATDVVLIVFEKQLSSAAQLMYAHTVLVSGTHSSSVWVCAHDLIIIRKISKLTVGVEGNTALCHSPVQRRKTTKKINKFTKRKISQLR